jgi:hypothetical protein
MKYKLFTFKDDKLLCWRLGPMNATKQKHFNKTVEVNGLGGHHKPPTSRGIWAFPYPHYDLFFCWHRWESLLPKRFKRDDQEHDETWWNERELALKNIVNNNHPTTFYVSGFYSHIFPEHSDYNNWYYWENARDWAKVAQRYMVLYYYDKDNGLYKMNYAKDDFEIFVP